MNLDDLLYESSDEECRNYQIFQNIPRKKPENSSKDTEEGSTAVVCESSASEKAVKFLDVELQLSEYFETFANDQSRSVPMYSNSYDDLCRSLDISLSSVDGQMPSNLFLIEMDKLKKRSNTAHNINQIPRSTSPKNKHFLLEKSSGQSFLTSDDRIRSAEQSFRCIVCGQVFSNTHLLNVHTAIHSDEKTYECPVCNKKFYCLLVLRKHKCTYTEKKHKCDVCKKCFARKDNLDLHLLTHTGERPHVCDVCQKAFALKYNLRNHHRTHTGERPHVWDVCQKAFALNSTLKIHRRTHTGKRPHI